MNVCYLGLGSNQKFPERQLRQAIGSLKALPTTSVIKSSSFYWTKAWGMQAQQDFCNAVLAIQTRLSPLSLLKHCQKIENTQGRIRRTPWGPRTLDIDILLYGNRHINTDKLTIPHRYMLEREFVLIPLNEINPLILLPN